MYATTETLLPHYVWIATSFDKKWAWKRAQELAQNPMYADLPRLLTQAMTSTPPSRAVKDEATTDQAE